MTGRMDGDDALVAAWDELRQNWLAHIATGGNNTLESRRAELERLILDTPPHGLRGVAAKTGYTLWSNGNPKRDDGPFGFSAPEQDMDYDILCRVRLARDLERMTGIVVHPGWDSPVAAENEIFDAGNDGDMAHAFVRTLIRLLWDQINQLCVGETLTREYMNGISTLVTCLEDKTKEAERAADRLWSAAREAQKAGKPAPAQDGQP